MAIGFLFFPLVDRRLFFSFFPLFFFVCVAGCSYDNNSDATVAALQQLAESGAIDFVIHDGDIRCSSR